MPLVTTHATILKTYEYSETSKILRLLTRDHGLCSVIAKGARRPRSRFGGLLEPFTDGIATYYAKESRDLHTLSGFELLRERQALGNDLVRFAGAGILTEMAFRFAPSVADPELHGQLRRGLDRLVSDRAGIEIVILEETWKLIVTLGFGPSVELCVECGRPLSGEENARFSLIDGVMICHRCHPGVGDLHLRSLDPATRAELSELLAGGTRRPALLTTRAQFDLLREFIAYHLADQRPLNSLRFLEERLG
jgi:DNA repair protein RecO (recombination protein O)